jgi:hypothetical protein
VDDGFSYQSKMMLVVAQLGHWMLGSGHGGSTEPCARYWCVQPGDDAGRHSADGDAIAAVEHRERPRALGSGIATPRCGTAPGETALSSPAISDSARRSRRWRTLERRDTP